MICGHMALDKCNVSCGQQLVKNCCLPRQATYINKQNGVTTRKFINKTTICQICIKVKNVKEKKNTQQATGYMLLKLFTLVLFHFKLIYTLQYTG
jgi:hypothetical protein